MSTSCPIFSICDLLTFYVKVTKNTSSTNCGLPVRDRGANYYSLSYVIIVLSWLFVIARFAFKIFERHEVELDDWTILATTILGTALTAVTIGGTIKHGLGRDLWTVEPNEITKMLLYFEIVAVLYFTTLTLLKLSIIFFYIKVFTTMEAQRLLWSTAAFTAVWGTMYVLLAIFQCQPISYFWTHWDGTHQGSCLNINAITSSASRAADELEKESRCCANVRCRHFCYRCQYPAATGARELRQVTECELGILRCIYLEHHRTWGRRNVVSNISIARVVEDLGLIRAI
jgi:hypothetical protein